MYYENFTIVLPTLNEEKSVGILIRRLLNEYKGIRIMVVDDGSADNTKMVVGRISRTNNGVIFFDRSHGGKRQRGLTASAIDGMIYSKTRFAIVMDADLQHPAEVIGKIAAKLANGDDLVVAVRSDVRGWEFHRKLISKTLIFIGYAILAATGRSRCNDIFSGFFGVDRELFVDTYKSKSRRFVGGGYKILYDFLKCKKNGSIKIGEVPYSFGLRKYGASKAGFRQGMLLFKSFLT